MTIFEYLYGDVYYTDEYGNAYFDSCVDIDYELDEIPEIVNLGDHTYFMAKEDLDLYNQYDIKVDGVSEDDLRFLHYTRRPYYQMRGRPFPESRHLISSDGRTISLTGTWKQ